MIIATGAWFDPGFGKAWQPHDRAGNPNVLTLDIGTSSLTQGPNALSCLVGAGASSYKESAGRITGKLCISSLSAADFWQKKTCASAQVGVIKKIY